MKSLIVSIILITISLHSNCQQDLNLKAMIVGYKTTDTIKIADCSKLSEISLTDKAYSIAGFTMFYTDKGYDIECQSNSGKFTQEMKDNLSKLKFKDNEVKFFVIKDIKVESPQNKNVKIENLYYHLRMK